MKSLIIFTGLLLCISTHGYTQEKYDPFDGDTSSFHADLTRYFKSPEAEIVSGKLLLDSVKMFRMDSLWTLSNVSQNLDRYEHLLISLQRHRQYHRLRAYINNKDTLVRTTSKPTSKALNALTNQVNQILQQPQFIGLTDQQLAQYGLLKYGYMLRLSKQNAIHRVTDHGDKLADKSSGDIIDKLTMRYDSLMNDIKANDIIIGDKKYNPLKDHSLILKNTDPTVREVGSKAYYDTYNAYADMLATTLIGITRQETIQAKLHNFNSEPERSYMRKLQLSEPGVKKMLEGMTRHANVLNAYQLVKMEQMQKLTGLEKIHSWDTSLPMGYTWQPKSYADTKQLILTALGPLGNEYQQDFSRLLDPANGALEIANGPNRVTEFTSVGYTGVPIGLYMKTYDGSLQSVLVLAHEGGHAIHEQLMSDHCTVPSYSSGPDFLNEAYAMFNELLMLDKMQEQANTTEAKAFFTRQFAAELAFEVFTSAQEGAFEQGLYDGVSAGKINTREDIDSLYSGIMKQYDIYFADEPQRRSEWINKRLVFDDPLYNVNYLYAILVSCKLYEMQHADPKGFAIKYNALLKNGFDASAEDLLKKYMGFGLDNEALLNNALGLMKDKTAILKNLYGQLSGKTIK